LKLSVVIPSHRRVDLLGRCLESVCLHAPTGAEVLVVDDGSPGGGVGATARTFPGVAVLTLESRAGFCVAANTGVRAARHPVVELLNDDVEVTAGWAEAALARFADPSVGAVAPLTLWGPPGAGGPRVDSAGDRYHLAGVAGKRGHGGPLRPEWLRPGWVFGASAAAAFYRREAFLAVGGFPEAFAAYFEDVDLSFRLHWAGWRVFYEPAARVWHRVSSSYAPGAELVERQSCNEERLFWRNLPAGALRRALPWHALVLAGKAWRRWREGRLGPFLRGRWRAWGEVGEALRHRRRLQGGRAPDLAGWGIEEGLGALR
jgi:GT2 family glycosyltransferase